MKRAQRVCPTRGCINLIGPGQKLCPVCRQATYDDGRLPSSKRGYGAQWRKIRDEHLQQHPFCVDCGRRATEIDHHIPRQAGGSDDHSNLRSRCKRCHSQKTAKFDGGFGNKKQRGQNR